MPTPNMNSGASAGGGFRPKIELGYKRGMNSSQKNCIYSLELMDTYSKMRGEEERELIAELKTTL